MGRQINFYAMDDDRKNIAEILNSHFGQMLEIPFYKDHFKLFEDRLEKRYYLLTDEAGKEYIKYRTYTSYNGSQSLVLDNRESPILEYSVPFKNLNGAYVEGRFYTCSQDKDFGTKVAKFFIKLKKEFIYLKKKRIYISKNIDIDKSLFLLSNKIIKLENNISNR